MPVLEVEFDGNTDQLQEELDNADLEADVDVQGDAPAGAGGEQEEGGGPLGTRTAIVGAITALVGLLTPIKEILEGIQNFFLVALAPIFEALRPVLSAVRKAVLGVLRFIGGDLTLDDLIGKLEQAVLDLIGDFNLGDAAEKIADVVASALDGIGIDTPLGEFEVSTGQEGTNTGTRTPTGGGGEDSGNIIDNLATAISAGTGNIGGLVVQQNRKNYIADRTDEANKERDTNAQANEVTTDFGSFKQTIERLSGVD